MNAFVFDIERIQAVSNPTFRLRPTEEWKRFLVVRYAP
jgi:hypothetical protein